MLCVIASWHTEPPLPTSACMGGGVSPEERAAFFLGGGSPIFTEIVCSGAARKLKGSADPPELSGGTRLDFKGALSNINYALCFYV